MPDKVNLPMDNASAAAILVVDDEAYVRQVISRWLTEVGLPSAQAESADAAWAYLQQHDVHIVTLDVSMPGRPAPTCCLRLNSIIPTRRSSCSRHTMSPAWSLGCLRKELLASL